MFYFFEPTTDSSEDLHEDLHDSDNDPGWVRGKNEVCLCIFSLSSTLNYYRIIFITRNKLCQCHSQCKEYSHAIFFGMHSLD